MSMKSISKRVVAGLALAFLMIGCAETERNRSGEAPGAPDATAGPGSLAVSAVPGSDGPDAPQSAATVTAPTTAAPPAYRNPSEQSEGIVLFVGTSLTAGYGLASEFAFPSVIQGRIDAAGLPYRAVNAGVSGETSAGALRRVDWLLQQPFDVLVLETGANDMLRGIDPAATEANIQEIIERVRSRRPDARIVLAGMLAMPNLGPDYRQRFESIYPRLAERNQLTLIPFLLEGVAADRELNLADGIHPNAQGQRIVAETVWATLEPALRAEAGS
jgi:acyl-CoA thioesterase I